MNFVRQNLPVSAQRLEYNEFGSGSHLALLLSGTDTRDSIIASWKPGRA